jgi:PPOX class probable F420-dependent enzyme
MAGTGIIRTMPPPSAILTRTEHVFLAAARRATLATTAPDGRARLVPICFVLAETGGEAPRPVLYTPLDEKPKKTGDPNRLGRVRDIERDAAVSVLVDRWDEDWTQLAWLRCDGLAGLIEPGSAAAERETAIVALRAKYPQYLGHALEERPLIRVALERAVAWGDLSDRGTPRSPSDGGSGSSSSPGGIRRR